MKFKGDKKRKKRPKHLKPRREFQNPVYWVRIICAGLLGRMTAHISLELVIMMCLFVFLLALYIKAKTA